MRYKNHYGTFAAKQPWRFKPKLLALDALAATLVFAAAFVLFKQDPKEEQLAVSDSGSSAASAIPGWWYSDYFGASTCDGGSCAPEADPDEDKLTNEQEYFYHSNPLTPDSNQNGATDGADVAAGFDPSRPGQVTFEELESAANISREKTWMRLPRPCSSPRDLSLTSSRKNHGCSLPSLSP